MREVACRRGVVFASDVGEVDAEFSAHYLVFVEVPDCGCGSVCVCEFGKAKAFRSAGVVVVDEPEAEDLANGAEYGCDLFFREACLRAR